MLSDTDRQFVWEHLQSDLHRLLLAAHRYPGVSVQAAVGQIEALRKIRSKIPSWFRPGLELPAMLSVEQASSEATARYKSSLFSGKKMADLTGGMGVDAYFFAQQFESVVYVEHNPALTVLARHNFGVLGAPNIRIEETDAAAFLKGSADHYDLLYLDPARRDRRQKRVFRLEDCEPNVVALKDNMLAVADRVLLKTAPLLDLNLAAEQLQSVAKIWVLSVENEVKEVLYLLEKSALAPDSVPIEAISLGSENRALLFTRLEEKTATPVYTPPLKFLYEPDAAVLKAGAFKTFASRFGLAKLHPNSHLYTSEACVPNLPGRSFIIEAVCRYDRNAVQALVLEKKANIAVRNFPDPAERVREKLGLADGGDWYLFGTTDPEERKILILCKKVPQGQAGNIR